MYISLENKGFSSSRRQEQSWDVIPNLGLFLAPWVRIMLSTVSPFHRHTLP
jgi:hypothetical protein